VILPRCIKLKLNNDKFNLNCKIYQNLIYLYNVKIVSCKYTVITYRIVIIKTTIDDPTLIFILIRIILSTCLPISLAYF